VGLDTERERSADQFGRRREKAPELRRGEPRDNLANREIGDRFLRCYGSCNGGRIGTIKQRAAFTPGKQMWRRPAVGGCSGIRASDGKRMRRRLTEITGQFLHGCGQGGAPEGHAARLRLRFTGETPRGDFSVDFLSEKDNPCYGVFSVLKYGQTPFGIWRTRIWKMATAEADRGGRG
jgi:hypothetical protein